MSMHTPTPAYVPQVAPTPVVLVQDGWDVAVRILLAVLGVLHAVTCIVFLYVVYSVYQALAELQANLQQLGSMFGAGG